MKKNPLSISDVRAKIDELKGTQINLQVCRGRKKVVNYSGILQEAFARVFVVKVSGGEDVLTYSYSDIVCGEVVVIKP